MIRRICAVSAVLVVAAGCLPSTSPEGRGPVSHDGTVHQIAPEERGDPVRLAGTDLDGKPLAIPERSDRATILNVWWSGCAECRVEAPQLRAMSTGPDKVGDFYGIDVRESGIEQARRFEERFKITYPSFYDPSGELLLNLNGAVPYAAIPTTIILDQRMRIGSVIFGVVPSIRTMKGLVEDVLKR